MKDSRDEDWYNVEQRHCKDSQSESSIVSDYTRREARDLVLHEVFGALLGLTCQAQRKALYQGQQLLCKGMCAPSGCDERVASHFRCLLSDRQVEQFEGKA